MGDVGAYPDFLVPKAASWRLAWEAVRGVGGGSLALEVRALAPAALDWVGFVCGPALSQISGFALMWSILAFVLAQSQCFVEAAVGAGGRGGIGGRVGGGPNFRLTSSLVNCQGLPRTPDAAVALGARWR
jgi:hypothetical protein